MAVAQRRIKCPNMPSCPGTRENWSDIILTMILSREIWEQKLETAQKNSTTLPRTGKMLISVAAQHPLKDGLYPGFEFAARLDKAYELHEELHNKGIYVEIYIPGSRHRIGNIEDVQSLSRAGQEYLKQHGIPLSRLHGEDLNSKYKGDDGVYNTADECYVTGRYFYDGGFEELLCVVSPVQVMRQSLHYIWIGILPQFYSVTVKNMYHDYIKELFGSLAYTRDTDPDWQGQDSEFGNKSRVERRPYQSSSEALDQAAEDRDTAR